MIFDPGFGCFLCLADICLLGALSVCVCVCLPVCVCYLGRVVSSWGIDCKGLECDYKKGGEQRQILGCEKGER